ncbi:MAG: GyrI-like domain-containing protein [Bacteroidetes bacterium]|nr:GyrI-like domain-containing protein [Bacteroidota bacterium]
MKTFKKIVIWILAIILVLILVSYVLPKTYKVERSVYIKSKPELIYDITSNFNKWKLWVPWTKALDSTAVFELTGKEGQVGTIWKWNGKVLGNGQMTATEFIPGQLLAYDLSFDKGKYQSKGKITIEKAGDSCKVSWIDEGDLGYNPISRYFGLLMDKMMGPDFIKGLNKLKNVCEARAFWPRIEETTMPEQIALVIRDSAGPKTYEKVMGKGFGELMGFVKANKLKCKGHPFAIYVKYDTLTMNGVMDIGIAVEKADHGKGRVKVVKLPAQNCVIAYYIGPYDKSGDTYRFLHQYIREAELQIAGGPWEIYVNDPMTEKDPSKLETNILFPVK